MKLKERLLPDHLRAAHQALAGQQHARSFRVFEGRTESGEGIRAFLSKSPVGELPDGREDLRWHISVSIQGQKRLPTWEEMKEVHRALKPDVFMVIAMPPERYWMNVGEVLHLSETKDRNAIEHMKFEGLSAQADARAGLGYGATAQQAAVHHALRRGKKPPNERSG